MMWIARWLWSQCKRNWPHLNLILCTPSNFAFLGWHQGSSHLVTVLLEPTPVFLPGEFHGQRSLVGYSIWDCKNSDTIEQISFTFYPLIWLCNCFNKTIWWKLCCPSFWIKALRDWKPLSLFSWNSTITLQGSWSTYGDDSWPWNLNPEWTPSQQYSRVQWSRSVVSDSSRPRGL